MLLLKKPIIVFVLILISFSFLRFFRFMWNSSLSLAPPSVPNPATPPHPPHRRVEETLTPKEHRLLSNVISQRAPCNLLFFGFSLQFLPLAALNSQGTTIFLEDDPEKLRVGRSKGLRMHLYEHHERASKAYELLRHARGEPACRPSSAIDEASAGCKLALRGLPKEVHETQWDAVVVDGPIGDRAEAPGRMGAIYMAAVFARRRGADVLVHDTDRSIEKWYSWEFLCHENLVSSKGNLWHFRIAGNSSSGERFCEDLASPIQ
ncbi:putative methyltransferase [Canna indica]|uniref:Methyltransferase n=1 Tax=Canna indica TaxID=4628 RepID=A0AAQ3QFY9_9LILI|nr:putative methyltransferase [Canna indica]